jgi:hypothetical protein
MTGTRENASTARVCKIWTANMLRRHSNVLCPPLISSSTYSWFRSGKHPLAITILCCAALSSSGALVRNSLAKLLRRQIYWRCRSRTTISKPRSSLQVLPYDHPLSFIQYHQLQNPWTQRPCNQAIIHWIWPACDMVATDKWNYPNERKKPGLTQSFDFMVPSADIPSRK